MKLENTKALAKIFNTISQELKTKRHNFKVDVDTLKSAISDFLTELDYNLLQNYSFDLIISRLEQYFESSEYFCFDDINDDDVDLLDNYKSFVDILESLCSYEGLQYCKEQAEQEQRKQAATTPKIDTLTFLKLAQENDDKINAPFLKTITKASDKDINKLKDLCSEYGTFDKGFGDLSWHSFRLNGKGLEYIKAATTPPKTPQPQPYKLELTKELEKEVLKNFEFWNNQNDKTQGKQNIFKNITQAEFLQMIINADFSQLNKKGISQRVKYNISVLVRILGKEWGENAAQKLNTTIEYCAGRTEFNEHTQLKTMYLQ